MTPRQECSESLPAVSYGSFLGPENVGEVSQAAVLNYDLKGLGFPKVTVESEKAMTAYPYTSFTWAVAELLNMQYWGVCYQS